QLSPALYLQPQVLRAGISRSLFIHIQPLAVNDCDDDCHNDPSNIFWKKAIVESAGPLTVRRISIRVRSL
ncbi:MAG: hypothetical protein ABFS43_18640, partial [Thermodesulfobacteriota bacterium]